MSNRWRSCRKITVVSLAAMASRVNVNKYFSQSAYAFFTTHFFFHPNFQRLAKLFIFGGFSLSKKVEFFNNVTFLVNSLIQKMPNYFKRPIWSKISSQPGPALKAETAPSDGRIGKPSTYWWSQLWVILWIFRVRLFWYINILNPNTTLKVGFSPGISKFMSLIKLLF